MKTSTDILRKRGFLTDTEAEPFFLSSKEELLELLNDKQAVNRTAALNVLKTIVNINELDEILLKMLVKEKALYTKIKICDILADGNELTIKRMIPYIGKIGANQHRTIPKRCSKKKSYPLPRDIIARTIAKMDSRYFDVILENINNQNDFVVAEIIDAVGWQIFYHQELAIEKNYQVILDTIKRYQNNEFMLWKLIICLSAFNQAESLLKQWQSDNFVIKQEIERSIGLINKRKGL